MALLAFTIALMASLMSSPIALRAVIALTMTLTPFIMALKALSKT